LTAKLVSILVAVVLLENLVGVINKVAFDNLYILRHLNASYDDRMREKVGFVFYNFTQFIVKNTPENANLLIPPQAFPWPQSGNGAYMRYFVYPRNVGNGGKYPLDSIETLRDFDYVLLAWGESEKVQDEYMHGWPMFNIPAEKIILMNEDGTFKDELDGDYYYNDFKDKNAWGLIKVRH
jgi:hypothetical protein